jgi:hypothetical protein
MFTASKLHASFCLWAALEPKAANQAFNVVNGDTESWSNLWFQTAKHFGIKVKASQFQNGENAVSQQLAEVPPLAEFEEQMGLQGTIQPNKLEGRIDLTKWSQKDEVKDAWKKLAEREGLEKDALEKATWTFLQFVLGRNYDMIISMSKARKFGWTG